MARHGKKTPRSQAETGPPEPVAEPAVAPASEVPEGTAGQDGDGDLGGDAGAAAASSAAGILQTMTGRADEPAAEEGAALAAAPTQTMEAQVFAPPPRRRVTSPTWTPTTTRKLALSSLARPRARARARAGQWQRQQCRAALPRASRRRRAARAGRAQSGSASAASTLARYLRADELDQDDDDEEDDEEDAPRDADATGPGGSLAVLAEGAAVAAVPPVARVQKKEQHKSGVWGVLSPTGYPVAKERVAAMDHTDGKPWEVEVWNMLEDPGGGNEEVNFQSVARFYEQKTRAIMTVPHMGKMKDDELIGIEPHDRMFPTGFYQPKGDFKGTILSCIDLVYCDGADKATPYSEWRGTLHTTVEANTKRFISEICAGYYAKLNTNSKPMKEKTCGRCCTRFARGAATSASRRLPSWR